MRHAQLQADFNETWDCARLASMNAGFPFKDIVTGQMITPPNPHVGMVDAVVTLYNQRVDDGLYTRPSTPLPP